MEVNIRPFFFFFFDGGWIGACVFLSISQVDLLLLNPRIGENDSPNHRAGQGNPSLTWCGGEAAVVTSAGCSIPRERRGKLS